MSSRSEHPRKGDKRGGQALVLASSLLFVLFAVTGFAVDLGSNYFQKEQMQAAADAASTAAAVYASNNAYVCGAGGVSCPSTYTCTSPTAAITNAMTAGCKYAEANGFTQAGTQTVSMTQSNAAVPNEAGTSPAYWVQATISQTAPNLFLYWAGFHSATTSARGIAAIATTSVGGGANIIALQDFSKTGSGNITTDGSVSVGRDFSFVGSGDLLPAGGIKVARNLTKAGSGNINAGGSAITYGGVYTPGSGSISPAPTSAASSVSDPFASLPAPAVGACDHTGFSVTGAGNATLNPGVYCDGLSISGSGTITFNPGTYIINGGQFNSSNSGVFNGNGVMFFITGQGGHTASNVLITGSGTVNFSAPSSGTYQGILFYQDRSVTYALANSLTGSGMGNATGTFYFPTTSISYAGSGTRTFAALVAKNISITGSSNLQQDVTGTKTGFVKTSATLIQ